MYIKRLKDLREDNDFTQKYIAKLLGIDQRQYSRYELGKYEIPIKHLITLCKLYNVTLDYIVGLNDKKKN